MTPHDAAMPGRPVLPGIAAHSFISGYAPLPLGGFFCIMGTEYRKGRGTVMMNVEIRELDRRDYEKAVQFAIVGMHFDWYVDSPWLLNLYGQYFWYLELSRATQVIAAYVDGILAGVLLAEMKGEAKKRLSPAKMLYVRVFEALQRLFSREGGGLYEQTARALLAQYLKTHAPDGEILFLAADPQAKVRGIGSALLAELERRERGKTIYLQTDDACTYPFYEHRGFARACEKQVALRFGKKQVPLKCFLYTKTIPPDDIMIIPSTNI